MSGKTRMQETVDRRRQRTQAALHGAFRDLLLAQGYEAVTVGALASSANIGRSTFYEHYRTKDELLRASVRAPFATLASLVESPASADALGAMLRHFREHQQVARVLLAWPTRGVLAAALADGIAERLGHMHGRQAVLPREVIARQVADMQLALVEAWISGRPAFSLEAAVQALSAGTAALVAALYR
jgi:AcrR family transcriptional regulator